MNPDSDLPTQYWKHAARLLQLRIEAPFIARHAGTALTCTAHVRDFGKPSGTLVIAKLAPGDFAEFETLRNMASNLQMHACIMHISPAFSQTEFEEALADWGYYGPTVARPSWLPPAK